MQPELFDQSAEVKVFSPEDKVDEPKYQNQRLDEETEKTDVQTMLRYVTEEKPYLDSELTLSRLAEKLSFSPYYLSMLLNLHLKQNFYTFINKYRIDEVKRKLEQQDRTDENILEIAFDAGFNSKSTFNSMFKKFTHTTPSRYRKNY